MIRKIVSGGQTGADRAGLDFAIARGIDHEGWCPRGRKAIDGPLDSAYRLRETPSKNYPQRTGWNVRDSDGTVIFTLEPVLTGGSKKTSDYAENLEKPWSHLHRGTIDSAGKLRAFIETSQIEVLNIAGSREDLEGESIYLFVLDVLERSFPEADPSESLEEERATERKRSKVNYLDKPKKKSAT